MSNRSIKVTQRVFARVGICLLGTAALMLPPVTAADAMPVVIRGIPSTPASSELRLAYLASFPAAHSSHPSTS